MAGGARASVRPIAGLAVGQYADLQVLDRDGPDCSLEDPSSAVAAWIFGTHGSDAVRDVMVGGRWVVEAGHHAAEARALRDYLHARDAILER
jgi:formimidoylglutamate deiminase